jgi:pilus assembly protein CpaE
MDIFEALPSEELETIAQLLSERRLTEAEVSDCQLLVLDKDAFDELLASRAQIMREMLKVVSQRTLNTNQQLLADEPGNAVSTGAGGVYAIFSPRGGSGKTTLAVNMAAQHALEHPERTALLDLSLTFGHTGALLGLAPETSLAAVPAESLSDFDHRTLGQSLVEHSTSLQLLVAGTRPEEGELVTAAHVRAALGTMKRQFNATFVDCGCNFDEPTIAALEMADAIIVICTPELNTLRDVRECQRIFGEIIRQDMKRVRFVFNHNQPFSVLSREQFESALEQPMDFELPHAGEAAYKAANRGEPVVLAHSGSAYGKAVERMRRTLVPIEARITSKRRFSVVVGGREDSKPAQRNGLFAALRGKRAS